MDRQVLIMAVYVVINCNKIDSLSGIAIAVMVVDSKNICARYNKTTSTFDRESTMKKMSLKEPLKPRLVRSSIVHCESVLHGYLLGFCFAV